MQASVLGPQSVDGVRGESLVHATNVHATESRAVNIAIVQKVK